MTFSIFLFCNFSVDFAKESWKERVHPIDKREHLHFLLRESDNHYWLIG